MHDDLDVSKVDASADLLVREDGANVQLEFRSIEDGTVVTQFPSKERADNITRNTNRIRFSEQAQSIGLPIFNGMPLEQQLSVLQQPCTPQFLTVRFQGGEPTGFWCTSGLDPEKCGDAVLTEAMGSCVREAAQDDTLLDQPDETLYVSIADAVECAEQFLSQKIAPLLVRLDVGAQKPMDEPGESAFSDELDFLQTLDSSSKVAGSKLKQSRESQSLHLKLFHGVCSRSLALSPSCAAAELCLQPDFLHIYHRLLLYSGMVLLAFRTSDSDVSGG